ncbi:ribosomal RNA methyltransferase, putative [Perkinsus marinus ATCC 50983]|uniref:Ribosomal RNA methyltransferase, putative n=1 Tax=Perkinsus marinus (strain ATCC 50983 / TXsc) TaxID=423536 RepID=C5LDA5_PERM5|nr:ribosomal RNA methyltransferase, putative [Perkinsus marinus ATCC 50983]EER05237.1 ribosomal RNA methyltransferase, putative [Perkinsus marinus ATCC 50983]|eukprot:XP_002773421.1 ribosomal RNA methyltransferase, putative [Perkinsus marinus ATCC 50983]
MWSYVDFSGGAFSASSMYEPDLFGGITQDDFEAANEVDEDVTALEGSEEDPTDRDIQPGQYEYIVGDNSSRLERMEKEMSEYHKNELRDAELRKEKAALKAKKGKKETRRERAAQEWAAEAREVTSEIEGKAVAAHEEQVRRELAGVSDDEDGESVDGYESDEGGDAAYVDGIQEDDDDEKGDSSDGEVEVPSKRSKESKASEEIVLPPEMSGAKGQIRTDRWFSQELFKEDSDDDDEMKDDVDGIRELDDEDLLKLPLTDKQLRKEKRKRDLAKKEKKEAKRARKMGEVEEEGDGHGHKDGDVAGTDVGGFEVVPASTASAFERPEDPQELAETLALGSLLTSKKSRMELIDSAYNRYTFADDHNAALPDWFVEEEKPFTRQMVPISKELMNQYRAKMREINARPVRKVAEAAARKKKRLTQQLEKLRKTATSLQESSDLGDSGKARAMRKAVGKVLRGNDKKEVAYAAVQGKGGSKVISKGASRGAKVKMVDKRLKNDKRAQKRADKRLKKAGAKRRAKKLPQKKKGKGM